MRLQLETIIRNKRLLTIWLMVPFICAAVLAGGCRNRQEVPKVEKSWKISPVWSGHPVGFTLLTKGNRQYVAYYDGERRMTDGRA